MGLERQNRLNTLDWKYPIECHHPLSGVSRGRGNDPIRLIWQLANYRLNIY